MFSPAFTSAGKLCSAASALCFLARKANKFMCWWNLEVCKRKFMLFVFVYVFVSCGCTHAMEGLEWKWFAASW
jgi:hypothetical protein